MTGSRITTVCGGFMTLAWVIVLLLAVGAGGQGLGDRATQPAANRYLFVVETSRAMEPRAAATVDALRVLVAGGMNGQMRKGDSIGFWTFNEDLQTGRMALQQWTPEGAAQVANRLAGFLEAQPFLKRGAPAKVFGALSNVVQNSEFLTVVLLTSGQDKFLGTPFDTSINRTFKDWESVQQKKQLPFVTVLRAKRGLLTDFSVTPLPFPIELPPLPAELLVEAAPAKPVPKAAAPVAPAPTAPPLIVTGKKPHPPEAAASPPAAASNTLATASSTSPAEPLKPELPATNPPSVAPAIPSLPQPAVDASAAAPAKPAEAPPAAPSETPTPVSATPEPSAETPPATMPTVSTAPAATPAAPVNATAPAQSFSARKSTRVAALVAAALSFGCLLLLLLRRPRAKPRGSLITRSLDREGR